MRELSRVGLVTEADFLRKHNSRSLSRQKKIKTIKIKGIHLFFVFSILVSLTFLIYKSAGFLLTWEKLNIKSYHLVNSPKMGTQKVRRIVQHYGGNILSFNFDNLRRELLTLTEVKDVALSKRLPSTIEVRFKLREPVFQVPAKNGYRIMDEEGKFLYTSPSRVDGLITIHGVPPGELERIIPYLPEMRRIRSSIDYIGFQEPRRVLVKLKGIDEFFYPGEDHFVDRIAYYLKLREKIPSADGKVKCVDLRFADRFYLEFEEEAGH
jgi:cell division septal protein FtsQ